MVSFYSCINAEKLMLEAINRVKIYVEIEKSNLWKHLLKANDNVYTLAFMNQEK